MDPVWGRMKKAVIIGNGVAGVWAASILAGSPEVSAEVLTDEEYLYYNRPHLLEYIAGRIDFERIFVYPEEWYAKRGIRMRLRESVLALDPDRKEVTLKGGKMSYDKLILSTGSQPVLPPIKGTEKKGVFTLRSARDALSIRERALNGGRAVVIGGGLLGLEVAGALHALGLEVTVVEFLKRLLPRQTDEQAAQLLSSMMEKMGIRVIVGGEVESILGGDRMERIVLKDGTSLQADLSVISVGIRPRVDLATAASIKVDRGIVVDHHMQTSAPDIYACGDVAEMDGKIGGVIPVALDQAKVAALNILGEGVAYQSEYYSFTLRISGIRLASIGEVNPTGGDYEERRNIDLNRGIYTKLVFKDDIMVGAILLGDTSKIQTIQELIRRRQEISKVKDSTLGRGLGQII
jgi:NAD(P)H-nitrite reductase large subunit